MPVNVREEMKGVNSIRGKPSDMKSKQDGLKRYSLVIPDELFNGVLKIADEEHTTVVEILRKFIKLGLIAADVAKDPSAKLLIREGEKEREIVLI